MTITMFIEFVIQAGAVAAAIATLAGFVGAIWACIKKPWRKWTQLQTDFRAASDTLTHVKDQLGRNGGESVRDAVDRIEHGIALMRSRVTAMATVAREAIFETDVKGNFISINEAAQELTGLHLPDLVGRNWINAIAVDEQESFRRQFFSAIEDQREFLGEVHIITGAHSRRRLMFLRVQMFPMLLEPPPHHKNQAAQIIGWIGKFREIPTPETDR